MKPLTARQWKFLLEIYKHIAKHGRVPTIREIGAKLSIKSPNGVICNLKALEKKGHLVMNHDIARGIILPDLDLVIKNAASEAIKRLCNTTTTRTK